jgi:hypothetical protein
MAESTMAGFGILVLLSSLTYVAGFALWVNFWKGEYRKSGYFGHRIIMYLAPFWPIAFWNIYLHEYMMENMEEDQ